MSGTGYTVYMTLSLTFRPLCEWWELQGCEVQLSTNDTPPACLEDSDR